MTTSLHPFAHIMPGPYSYAGYRDAETIAETMRQVKPNGWIEFVVPPREGACIGTCDHCNTPISYAVLIKGANGVFKVGETCAGKINGEDAAIAKAAKAAGNDRRKTQKKAKVDAAYSACIDRMDTDESLRSTPHPKGWAGKTLWDYLEWYRCNAGRAKFVETFKQFDPQK